MKYVIVVLSLALSISAAAENSQLINCQMEGPSINGTLQLDAVGKGILKLTTKTGKATTCELKLANFQDRQRDVVPDIAADFSRGDCDPKLSALEEKELLKRISLKVILFDKKAPRASVQWLLREQPQSCQLLKFNLSEIEFKAKQWGQKNWGRR